tara:strand:+ start:334 stop:579 length:246 start_codon:yes stop_codon:yes gene_type:complete
MSWKEDIKKKDILQGFSSRLKWVQFHTAKQLFRDLEEVHHKLGELESDGVIDYRSVDLVADAMRELRKEIQEMREKRNEEG